MLDVNKEKKAFYVQWFFSYMAQNSSLDFAVMIRQLFNMIYSIYRT